MFKIVVSSVSVCDTVQIYANSNWLVFNTSLNIEVISNESIQTTF
jgi:hypothetical protein